MSFAASLMQIVFASWFAQNAMRSLKNHVDAPAHVILEAVDNDPRTKGSSSKFVLLELVSHSSKATGLPQSGVTSTFMQRLSNRV